MLCYALYAEILTSLAGYFIFEPLDPSDIADEEVRADAADVGDEKAAVGDRVDVRHHVVTQMFVPVTPLAAADRIKHRYDYKYK